MNSGYERAARRLSGIAEDDRDWLLARLPEADRLRINELIERDESGGQLNSPRESSSEGSASTPELTVAAASAAEVARALRDEPDWLVALILAKRRWPWDADYLNDFEPARVEKLRDIARGVRETAPGRARRLGGRPPACASLEGHRHAQRRLWHPRARCPGRRP